jgi:DNA-directed RNA polymerase specialized sigma24 family protein
MTTQTEQPDLLEQVLLSHAEMCYSVALSLTRDPERAQDLARQLLTGAWRLRDRAHGRKELKRNLLSAFREKILKDRRAARADGNEEAYW